MKEKLFDRSEAVAALNRVEGFNPIELARTLTKEGQENELYLDVKYRKLWFRLMYPLGKIVSSIRSFTENMAIVEARIYLDKCDAEENYISNAFSQKFRTQDPTFGDKFLEMAETAAVGRALSDAGFGIQFADVGEENDLLQVDAGVQIPGMAVPPAMQESSNVYPVMQGNVNQTFGVQGNTNPQQIMQGMQNHQSVAQGVQNSQSVAQGMQNFSPVTQGTQNSQPTAQENGSYQAPAQSQANMMNQFYQQAQETGATIGNGTETSAMQGVFGNQGQQANPNPMQQIQGSPQASNQYVPAAALDESMPVEELVKLMTYEQATKVVITGNGKFKGKTMGQVAVETPTNLNWFAQSYSGRNNLIPAAAKVLLNAAMPMAV
ncbi:hypothetical protein C808_02530 [Lachnospiraceae bacterium M18-1]|nr:hypothetical protein C808_02530 [Lachnospiraceae bacterium M18-1]